MFYNRDITSIKLSWHATVCGCTFHHISKLLYEMNNRKSRLFCEKLSTEQKILKKREIYFGVTVQLLYVQNSNWYCDKSVNRSIKNCILAFSWHFSNSRITDQRMFSSIRNYIMHVAVEWQIFLFLGKTYSCLLRLTTWFGRRWFFSYSLLYGLTVHKVPNSQ